ncbi:MAG TPA: hypothetical protein VNT30_11600 [Stellaceae bacterium]|nr:hypothetical protein [Stellaceae bacterium]
MTDAPKPGHNGGPPLDAPETFATTWLEYCWKKARQEAFKKPPREIMLSRLARAEELGMTYEQYTAIYLDTGRLL